ncbi:MAG: long-chain fatty-acid-CoA ligase [Verrucomicrobiales bacterium]|nr:long-chain fatty-acid-CoA ligase [Verrucomicrobiales bacterium]
MNLAEAFTLTVRKNSAKTAIFWDEEQFSYARILEAAETMAIMLQRLHGIVVQDRVGVWLRNCPEFVIAVFAVLKNGAVLVPINNFLKPEEVSHILQDAGIKVIITDDATIGENRAALERLNPGLRIITIPSLAAAPARSVGDYTFPTIAASELAVIIYTSGTTGRPKGAMLTHANLLHNVESCRIMLEAVSFDRFVVLLPMFHSFMLTVGIFLPFLIGGSILLIKSVHPPKNVIDEILRKQATILPAIPQFFRALTAVQLPENFPLRLCVSGAAPLPHEVFREFTAKFPIPLLEGYGLSEASPVVSMNPIKGPWKVGSIGIPVPNVEVSIQDQMGARLGPNVVGEVCVRGGNVMSGYWNQPQETATALRNGWLLTGDIGYQDLDGYIFITDRKKDMLLVNGINVYPREIEEVLYRFSGIKEAAVISQNDPRKGEQPLAFVAAQEGATLDERAIIHFLRERLADYKVPRKILILPALPRNATGKILKTTLREMVASRVSPCVPD